MVSGVFVPYTFLGYNTYSAVYKPCYKRFRTLECVIGRARIRQYAAIAPRGVVGVFILLNSS